LLALLCAWAVSALATPLHADAPALISPSVTQQGTKTLQPPDSVGKSAAPRSDKMSTPAWAALTPAQQQALQPLYAQWSSISTTQKRKWLEISNNFPKLPTTEQAKLHSRMSDWIALSPQQRAQARINFAQTKQLTPDEKKAKWQAYQSLSTEEKQRLTAKATPRMGAATAIKPVGHRLAVVPPQQASTATSEEGAAKKDVHSPKIAAAPHQVDGNTLLPQHLQVVAPVQQR
jgi:hypothetical protein